MKKLDAKELVNKAFTGTVNDKELAEVVQRVKEYLEHKGGDDDIHSLFQILGYCRARQYRDLIEKFLYFPSDSFVTRSALELLCNDWDFTEEYLNDLLTFIKGVEWDVDMEVRDLALLYVGSHIRNTGRIKNLKFLLEIFENKQECSMIRESAYIAIKRAFGTDNTFDYIASHEDFDSFSKTPIVKETIEKAHRVFSENEKIK